MLMPRKVLVPVRFGALDAGLRRRLIAASEALATLPPLSTSRIRGAPDERFASLFHRLSPFYMALNAPPRPARRSEAEKNALRRLCGSGGDGAATAAEFTALLAALNQRVTAGAGTWRDGPLLGIDEKGHRIQFPDLGCVRPQLEHVRRYVRDEEGPAVFRAVAALALTVNAHPFTDGNGRTARALFNHVLRRGGMPGHVYFSFREIADRSRGSYLIALRCAELHGDWQPIMRYALDAIRCHRDLAWTA